MRICLLGTFVVTLLASGVGAQEPIPQPVLKTIKAATVFIQVKSEFRFGSGSGFLVHTDKDYGYVITNRHVVEDNVLGIEATQKKELQVVFHSGSAEEIVLPAEIFGVLHTEDLAILRVKPQTKLPRPLDLESKEIPVETTTLYSFGFPFGKLLASSKGSPEITVGRATVSSLRRNDRMELKAIQLDGSLNPGNSGGPVTDSKGRVIGVVVSGVRGSNIGFAIPSAEVAKLLDGAATGARFKTKKVDEDGTHVEITAVLLDPMAKLKSASLRYVREDKIAAKPDRADTKPIAKAATLTLNRTGASAIGQLVLAAEDRGKSYWYQVAYAGADGVVRHTAPESFRVSAAGKISSITADLDKLKGGTLFLVYSIQDNGTRAQIEAKMRSLVGNKAASRTFNFGGRQRMEVYPVEDPTGFVERLEQDVGRVMRIENNLITLEIEIPPELARAAELYVKFDALKVKPSNDDPKEPHKPTSLGADAWKRLTAALEKKEYHKSGTPGGGAGADGPEDLPGEGGILIGFNITMRTFIESIQPIYLTAKGEKLGKRIGPEGGKLHTIKSEAGYAVGAVNLRNGDLMDAVTVIFMKMKQDGLDVNDAYRSPQLGGSGGNTAVVGGDGAFLLGIQTKILPSPYVAPTGSTTSLGVISLKK